MDDQFNTIAGWALGAGIVALGLTIVSGEFFAHHPVEKGGYPIEAEAEGGDSGVAEVSIATLMQTADAAKGEGVFKKCAICHTVNAGGANGQGPNLHGILGRPIGKAAGFAYSPAVAGKGGSWDFEAMNAWLKSPKKFIDGTKMSFGGLGKGSDRADLIAYLNGQGSNLPLPAADAKPADGEAAANAVAAPTK